MARISPVRGSRAISAASALPTRRRFARSSSTWPNASSKPAICYDVQSEAKVGRRRGFMLQRTKVPQSSVFNAFRRPSMVPNHGHANAHTRAALARHVLIKV